MGACRRLHWLLLPALVLLTSACAGRPPAAGLDAGLHRLEAALVRLERQGMVGQIAVAHAGQLMLLQGYGTMHPEGEQPVTPRAVMPLASLSKPFTASAVLRLAADARLALSDPIGLYLDGLDPDWADATIEDLLTHSAGLPAEIHNRNWTGDPRFEPIDRDELIRRVNAFGPDHPTGARFRYSNVTYNLLAALIEKISGQAAERYLRERLLEPAAIRGIGLLEPGWSPSHLVAGRSDGRNHGHYLERPRLGDGLGYNLRGAGDLLARPGAIVDWYRAIREDRWLPPPWQARWLTPRVREADGSRYGYGLRFRTSRWGPVIGHRGGDGVFAVDFSWFTGPDVMVYIATASARHKADLLASDLHARLLGR